jgi:MFS family permease
MATSPPQPPPAPKESIFAVAEFRTIWFAQFVSIFGDFIALFAIISLITFRWHGSPVQVTAMTIAYVLPLAIIGPPAGVLVDHWNVKRVMIASDVTRAALALLLVWVGNVKEIAVVMFAISVMSSAFMPAQSISIRTLIPRVKRLNRGPAELVVLPPCPLSMSGLALGAGSASWERQSASSAGAHRTEDRCLHGDGTCLGRHRIRAPFRPVRSSNGIMEGYV